MVLLGVTYLLFDRSSIGRTGRRPPGATGQLSTRERDRPDRRHRADWMQQQQAELQRAPRRRRCSPRASIALVVVGGAAIGLGWLIAGRVLAPLHQVTATARRIAAAPVAERGLHERIALAGPQDEVKELADTFDTMVERLDHSFDGQRRFVANASHELRTPLTLNRALVELAMHRRTASPDVKELGESLLEINARHERLISGLLLLARAEHEIADRSPVDLADVVSHVVSQVAPDADAAEGHRRGGRRRRTDQRRCRSL